MPGKIKNINHARIIFAWCFIALSTNIPAANATIAEGVLAYELGDYHKARQEWLPYAALGNANALYNLAQLYRMGRGVDIDYKKAEEYYLRAADKGHVGAQRNLGTLYYFSRLGGSNKEKSFEWLKKAAINGDARAQYMIGTMLYNGEMTQKDIIAAYAWISLSARQGLGDARDAEKKLLQVMDDKQIASSRKIAPGLLTRYQTPDDVGLMVTNGEEKAPAIQPMPLKSAAKETGETPSPAPSPTSDPAIKTTERPVEDNFRVQVASFRHEDNAQQVWKRLQQEIPEILEGLNYEIQYADLGPQKGAYYRLQIISFQTRAAAGETCNRLKDHGQNCYVIRAPK